MQLLRDYEDEYGVTIRPNWIEHDVFMTVGAKRTVISYRHRLAQAQVVLGVTTLLEVIGLRWPGMRFGFRYPLRSDSLDEKDATARTRRDYRVPERLAIRRLIPDSLLEVAEREEWELWQLAEACGLDEFTCAGRVRMWQEARQPIVNIVTFAAAVDLDGPIPF